MRIKHSYLSCDRLFLEIFHDEPATCHIAHGLGLYTFFLAQAEYITWAGSSPRIQVIIKDTEVRIGFAYDINQEASHLCTQTRCEILIILNKKMLLLENIFVYLIV
jgi:hypothetical protein